LLWGILEEIYSIQFFLNFRRYLPVFLAEKTPKLTCLQNNNMEINKAKMNPWRIVCRWHIKKIIFFVKIIFELFPVEYTV